jgi:tRNA (guanine37-N1)-methyltransferase
MLKIHVLTTLPEILEGALGASILGRARQMGILDVRLWNLRDFADDAHRKTDDTQYGGGEGMVMLAEPILRAAEAVEKELGKKPRTILSSPAGVPYTQKLAEELSHEDSLLLICGHYKGVDERVRVLLEAEEISIGDYVLTGGEVPALVIIDSVARLLPGAVGNRDSVESDSFTSGLLDCPRYTRPRVVRGLEVPEVLLSGHHEHIRKWRYKKRLEKTRQARPDLLRKFNTLDLEFGPASEEPAEPAPPDQTGEEEESS